MLKQQLDFLENTSGLEMYPLFSLILFFAFFSGVIWWAFTMRKSYAEEVKNIPLHEVSLVNQSRIDKQ